MSMRYASLALFCVFATIAISRGDDDGTILRWKFEKGRKLIVDMDQSMNQSVTVNGQENKVEQTTRMYQTWEITDIDDKGNAIIESVLKRGVMEMDVPASGKIKVDTNEAKDPPGLGTQLGQLLRPLVNAKCTQKMSVTGKISDVVIPENVLQQFRASPLMQQGMDVTMRDMMEKASPVYPDKPLKINDVWEQSSKIPNPAGSMTMTSSYTFKGPTKLEDARQVLHIVVDVKMAFESTAASIEIKDQKTRGNIYFDPVLGQLVQSNVEQDVTIEIMQAGLKLLQKITSKTDVRFRPER